MHFWAFSRLRQSGCKSKKYLVDMGSFEGPNLCALHHLRTSLILGGEKKSFKVKNFEVVSSTKSAVFFYSLSPQKFGHWALKWFSSRKILFWNIFKNLCGFNYFWTKINSWARFKGNWFSDPKRSGPVLGRLPLDIGITPKHWSTNFPTELFSFLT